MAKRGSHATSRLVILVILLTAMYIHAIIIDMKNGQLLDHTTCPRKYNGVIYPDDRAKIEQVIRDYKYRTDANTSKSNGIILDISTGLIRGALGGLILGGEHGIVPGMIAFGALNGITTWIKSNVPISKYIREHDGSAC